MRTHYVPQADLELSVILPQSHRDVVVSFWHAISGFCWIAAFNTHRCSSSSVVVTSRCISGIRRARHRLPMFLCSYYRISGWQQLTPCFRTVSSFNKIKQTFIVEAIFFWWPARKFSNVLVDNFLLWVGSYWLDLNKFPTEPLRKMKVTWFII